VTGDVEGRIANLPMALDGPRHRLLGLTREPPRLAVFDTETGKAVATLDADGDADDLFYPAARGGSLPASGPGR